MGDKDKLPEPSSEEEKKAEKEVSDWLSKQGYPNPDPKKQ
jgi:hypothetical protein